MNWYPIQTKPKQERLASANLSHIGIESFLPLMKERKGTRRTEETITTPLFPGYLFAKFDPIDHYRTVKYARGVRSIVTIGMAPAIVDEEIIASIQKRMEEGYLTVSTPGIAKGQLVRIQDGPMRGLEAIFECEMPGQQRALLLLKALAYQARVVVPFDHLGQIVGF
jgi:transcriptional antiterminator RfaH